MAYTIKTIRTRPNTDVTWSNDEIESLGEKYEDLYEQVDQETSEDDLVSITTFVVDVLRDLRAETAYSKICKDHRQQNNITRRIEVFNGSGNQIDSWED